jgi:hypothetical protein
MSLTGNFASSSLNLYLDFQERMITEDSLLRYHLTICDSQVDPLPIRQVWWFGPCHITRALAGSSRWDIRLSALDILMYELSCEIPL